MLYEFDQYDKHIYLKDAEGIYYSSGYIWDMQTNSIQPKPVGIPAQPFSPANAKGSDLDYFNNATIVMTKAELETKLQAQKQPAPMTKTEPTAPATQPTETTQPQTQTQKNTTMAQYQLPDGYSAIPGSEQTIALKVAVAAGSPAANVFIGDAVISPQVWGKTIAAHGVDGVTIGGTYGNKTLSVIQEFCRTNAFLITQYGETTTGNTAVFDDERGQRYAFEFGQNQIVSTNVNYQALNTQNTFNNNARAFGEDLKVYLSDKAGFLKEVRESENVAINFKVVAIQKNPVLAGK